MTDTSTQLGNQWWDIQEKVFTRWVNTHLKKRNLELGLGLMTRGGLDDGILLWELLSEISQKQITKPDRRGKMRIHYINNIGISLKFIHDENIKLVGIGAEDILDRKNKLILGLIWTLILRYQIQKGAQGDGNSAKYELLKWLRSIGIKVNDLTHDWTDGKQLCNLVNIIRPGLIPAKNITDDSLRNADQAINAAFNEFDIPQLLDPSDLCSETPDELVNMTYLSFFRDKWNELRSACVATYVGPNPITTMAKLPVTLPLETFNVTSAGQIGVTLRDHEGRVVDCPVSAKVKPNNPNAWDVVIVPPNMGEHTVEFNVGKKPVKNAPVRMTVTRGPSAAIIGPSTRKAYATKPLHIDIDTFHIKPKDLKLRVQGRPITVPHSITDKGNNIFDLEITPPKSLEGQDLTVDVILFDKEIIDNCPVTVSVGPPPSLKFCGLGLPGALTAIATRPFTFKLEAVNMTPDQVKVEVKDHNGKPVQPVSIKDNKDGTFSVTFTPMVPEKHKVNVWGDGELVEGSPLTIDVLPCPSASLIGPSHRRAVATKPVLIQLDTINVNPEDLSVTVKDADKKEIKPVKISFKPVPNGKPYQRTFDIEFVPPKETKMVAEILLEGKPVEGTPVFLDVTPKPHARITGLDVPGGLRGIATRPLSFNMDVVNLTPDDVQVDVRDGKGQQVKPVTIKDNNNGTFTVTFTPMEPEVHRVSVIADGSPAEGSPFNVQVDPCPYAKLIGPSNRLGTASKPVLLQIDAINVKPQDLTVKITGPDGRPVQTSKITNKPKDKPFQSIYDIEFIPPKEGKVKAEIFVEGKPVDGTPVFIDVAHKPTARLRGIKDPGDLHAIATKPFSFDLDVINLKPEDIVVKARDPDGKEIKPVTVRDNHDGTFTVGFTPMHPGIVKVDLTADGEKVDGSPLTVKVAPKPSARLNGPRERKGVAKKPFTFKLDVVNLKPEELELDVRDEHGMPVRPTNIKDNRDGTFDVTFTPQDRGRHTVNMKADGDPVENAPLWVDVAPAPYAKLIGGSKRVATASKPFKLQFDTINVGPDDLKIEIKDDRGRDIPFKVSSSPKGSDPFQKVYDVSFVPPSQGTITAKAFLEGKPVDGTPVTISVEHKPTAKLIGPSERDAIATKPFSFDLDVVNLRPDDVKVDVTDKSGRPVGPVNIKDNGDGTFTVGFIPMHPGPLNVKVVADGDVVEGTPLRVNVHPKPSAKLLGPNPREAVATKPFDFKLEVVNLKPDELKLDIKDDRGRDVGPVKVSDNRDGTFTVAFTPKEPGKIKVNMTADGSPVEGAPLNVNVKPKPSAKLLGPNPRDTIATKPFDFKLEVINLKPDELEVDVRDDFGQPVGPVQVKDNRDGTFTVGFTPQNAGKLKVNLKADGDPVERAPLIVNVTPKPSARVVGPSRRTAIATKPFAFDIDTVNLKPDDLKVKVTDADGRPVGPVDIRDKGDGTFEIGFVPMEPGTHKVQLVADGNPVEGAPVIVDVLPPPSATYDGPRPIRAVAKRPKTVPIKVVNLEPENFTPVVKDQRGRKIPVQVKDRYDGTFDITFTPEQPTPHTLELFVEGVPNKDGPIPIVVDPTPSARYKGVPELTATAKKPFSFPLDVVNLKPDDLNIDIRDDNNRKVPHKIKDNGDGTFDIQLVPQNEGPLSVKGTADGDPIDGFPLTINVLPEPSARLLGPRNRHARVGDPTNVKLDTVNLKPDDLNVRLVDDKGRPVPFKIKDNGDDTFDIDFVPENEGQLKLDMDIDGVPVEGAPVTIDVDPRTRWGKDLIDLLDDINNEAQFFTLVPVSDITCAETQQPVIFHAVPDPGRKTTATSVAFKPIVTTPSGRTVPAIVRATGSNFEVRFVPQTREPHTIDVKLHDRSIKKSPQTVNIGLIGQSPGEKPEQRDMNISAAIDRTSAVVHEPFVFDIYYQNCDEPHLIGCEIIDNTGRKLPKDLFLDKVRDQVHVTLTPEVTGEHKVRLLFDNLPVSGGFLFFYVNPQPAASVIGPSQREGARTVEMVIQVDSTALPLSSYKIGMKGPSGKVVASLNLDPAGKDVGITSKFTPNPGPKNPNGTVNGIYDFKWTPMEEGRHTMLMFVNGKTPVTGSPVIIDVGPSPLQNSAAGRTTVVNVATTPKGDSTGSRPYQPGNTQTGSGTGNLSGRQGNTQQVKQVSIQTVTQVSAQPVQRPVQTITAQPIQSTNYQPQNKSVTVQITTQSIQTTTQPITLEPVARQKSGKEHKRQQEPDRTDVIEELLSGLSVASEPRTPKSTEKEESTSKPQREDSKKDGSSSSRTRSHRERPKSYIEPSKTESKKDEKEPSSSRSKSPRGEKEGSSSSRHHGDKEEKKDGSSSSRTRSHRERPKSYIEPSKTVETQSSSKSSRSPRGDREEKDGSSSSRSKTRGDDGHSKSKSARGEDRDGSSSKSKSARGDDKDSSKSKSARGDRDDGPKSAREKSSKDRDGVSSKSSKKTTKKEY